MSSISYAQQQIQIIQRYQKYYLFSYILVLIYILYIICFLLLTIICCKNVNKYLWSFVKRINCMGKLTEVCFSVIGRCGNCRGKGRSSVYSSLYVERKESQKLRIGKVQGKLIDIFLICEYMY